MKGEGYCVAVVGATGAVGQEMVSILQERAFPVRELRLLASERTAGSTMEFKGRGVRVDLLTEGAFGGVE
ncbi:MAG: aspartate-semialdehyde dehydrogenase, partial [Deltaproteobacteria bacterium]|nr:aspartate-semialdehyde dehydrogenase [Deltaproteobacteria bacterium]